MKLPRVKLPRVRFTVRRMMVAVAVVALLIYGGMVRRHRLSLAALCEVADRGVRHTGASYRLEDGIETLRTVKTGGGRALTPAEVASRSRRAAYWVALGRKYERAALIPWLPISSDPPEPE
jgi:hypothetical protein